MGFVSSLIKKIRDFFYYERVVLYAYDLSMHHDFETIPNLRCSLASLKDVDQLYHDELNNDLISIQWDLWKGKISNGVWRGFICKDGDSIVAQAFYSIEDIFFRGTKSVILNLPVNSAYGFKLYTRPNYRGKKLGQAITSFRLNNAKKDGITKFYTVIYANNVVSRHNEEKIGGYLLGSVIFLKCRFFNKVILTPGIKKERLRIKKVSDY